MSVPDLYPVVTPTPRRIPDPYLRAEVTAFPLASEESFRLCLLGLDPSLADDDGGATRQLWRACESQLAQHTGWSLDRLIAARDRGWFGPNARGGRVSMRSYLRALARSHLAPRAGVTRIAEDTELSFLDAMVHYRWLTLVLPEDLLLSALGVEPAPLAVDLDPPMIRRRLLDLGVAEIHQHVGAAMDFPLLWVSALTAVATPNVGEGELESPGAPLGDGRTMVRWLLAAAIVRCVLAEHLIRGGSCLHTFLYDDLLAPGNATVWTDRRRETLYAVLAALVSADDERLPEIEPLRDLYADLHPMALTLGDHPLESLRDAYRRLDPVAVRLDLHGPNAGERWLMRKGLAYLGSPRHGASPSASAGETAWAEREPGERDDLFARLFWQTVRLRCQYYRSVVERPLTGGLQWFIRFYERLGNLRNPLSRILPEASFRHAAEGQCISALELRTSPADTAVELGEQLLEFLCSWRQVLRSTQGAKSEPEVGVVFHFVKQRDPHRNWIRGVPPAFWGGTYDEPEKGHSYTEHGRFAEYFAKQSTKARALAELIRGVPSCLWFLRGLDVATDELGVPTWVLVPLFRHVVDESARVSLREGAGPPLQLTAHVGEDFRHLMEGLRRIYEHIHYVLGGVGGRLGHAIALGVEPQTWAESVGSVLMPAEERLWDLVWEWRLYSKYRIRPEYAAVAPPGRLDVLVNQAGAIGERIFGDRSFLVEELAEAHHILHRFLVPPRALHAQIGGGFDTFRIGLRNLDDNLLHKPKAVREILDAYLHDGQVFRRGQELLDVPAERGEVTALYAVQNALRRGIGQTGIVIEVNPSSNLLIGDLLDLRRHPILRLFPPVPEPDGPPPVPIALGSDDPLTFSTRLLREYTLLYQSALATGYPERVVNDWLESIRRTGMDARFTLDWFPNASAKTEALIADLQTYLNRPGALFDRPGDG